MPAGASLTITDEFGQCVIGDIGTGVCFPLWSFSPTAHDPGWDREQPSESATFNFVPWQAAPNGEYRDLTFAVSPLVQVPMGDVVKIETVGPPHIQTVRFFEKRQPDFGGIGLAVRGADFTTDAPPTAAFAAGYADRALWAIWPLPTVGEGGYRVLPGKVTYNDQPDEDNQIGGATEEDMAQTLLVRRQCKLAGNQPDYIYGWLGKIPSHPAAANGFAVTPGHQAAGATLDWNLHGTYAHEVGHNAFEFNDEQGPEIVGEVGFDVLARLGNLGGYGFSQPRIRSRSLKRIMRSGLDTKDRWVSAGDQGYIDAMHRDEAYQEFRVSTAVSNRAVPGTESPYLLVSGRLDPSPGIGGAIDSVMWGDAPIQSSPVTSTLGSLVVVGGQEDVLFTTGVVPLRDTHGAFITLIPDFAATTRLEQVRDGQTAAVVARSASAPEVQILTPLPGSVITDAVSIGWTATDDDGGMLTSSVDYSSDGGLTWMPLENVYSGSGNTAIDTTHLPSSESAALRVRVTDGLNTSVETVMNLVVGPNRSPDLTLISPEDGSAFYERETMVLAARAFDAEDGYLGTGSYVWSSSESGVIGVGQTLNVSWLLPGTHTITVSATDSQGSESLRSVEVSVSSY